MKIGLKLFPQNLNLIDKYGDLFDFFEVFIIPEFDINKLKKIDREITIHATHSGFGVDLGNFEKYNLNKQMLDKAKKAADIVNSKYIVVHPGINKNEDSESIMFDFLRDNFDNRFIFENCIINEKKNSLFSTPNKMGKLLEKFNTGMCLDFEHAIVSANNLGKDAEKFIKDFLKLNPQYFHVCGASIDAKEGRHKHLFEVEDDYEYLRWIPKNKYICLETRHHITKKRECQVKDLELVRSIIK